MPANPPGLTAPISRTSRFSARPSVPSSNSSSSLAIAEGSPSTRAMPAPASAARRPAPQPALRGLQRQATPLGAREPVPGLRDDADLLAVGDLGLEVGDEALER